LGIAPGIKRLQAKPFQTSPGTKVRRFMGIVLTVSSALWAVSSLAESFQPSDSDAPGHHYLTIARLLNVIQMNDLTLARMAMQSDAHLADAGADSALPDPVLFAATQNLPTDTFDVDQEPMTQLRVGIRQMFPKGEALSLRRDIAMTRAGLEIVRQKLRWRELIRRAEATWLEAWYWQKVQTQIEEDRIFLLQVQEFIQSLYEVGGRDQSDLIGARLELLKLDDRLINARRNYRAYRDDINMLANEDLSALGLPHALPELPGREDRPLNDDSLAQTLLGHPRLEMMDEQIREKQHQQSLAETALDPDWGIEVSYGIRDGENPDGSDRPDFLSAGISMQLPLFTRSQQQEGVKAVRHRKAAIELEKREILQQSLFEVRKLLGQQRAIQAQLALYEDEILPTLSEQKQSALQNYESDKGDFRQVMALFLKEQDARLTFHRLQVDEQIMRSNIRYWTAPPAGENDS